MEIYIFEILKANFNFKNDDKITNSSYEQLYLLWKLFLTYFVIKFIFLFHKFGCQNIFSFLFSVLELKIKCGMDIRHCIFQKYIPMKPQVSFGFIFN